MSRFRQGPRRPQSTTWDSPAPESSSSNVAQPSGKTHSNQRIDRFDSSHLSHSSQNGSRRGATRRVPPYLKDSENLPTVEETSAGGMVIREIDGRHQVAIIARYNRGGRIEWVLPKGHPENDEDHRQAAEREVAEETGISGTVLTALGSIDYWFTVPGHRIHKTVHHFLLRATGGYLTIENDPDQEAIDVAWVDVDRVSAKLTFLNERRIVEAAQTAMSNYFDVQERPPAQRRIIPRPRKLPSGFIASVSGQRRPMVAEPAGSAHEIEKEPVARTDPHSGDDNATPTPFELRMRMRRFRAADIEPEDTGPQRPKPGPHLGRRPR